MIPAPCLSAGRQSIGRYLRADTDADDPTADFTGDDQIASELNVLAASFTEQVAAAEIDKAQMTPTISVHD